MTAKIIEFPGQWRGATEAAPGEGGLPRVVLKLVIGTTSRDSSPLDIVSVRAEDTLADLHQFIIQHFGWDDSHNYYFSQGSYRFEDPLLFAAQDRLSARCRRIYCAADVPLGLVFGRSGAPLYYMYNLTSGRELKITLDEAFSLELFG